MLWTLRWPFILIIAIALVIVVTFIAQLTNRPSTPREVSGQVIYDLSSDCSGEYTQRLIKLWRRLNKAAVALLVTIIALAVILIARPSHIEPTNEQRSNRDIVLCLDVSGSALPYDLAIINAYRTMVEGFTNERIALSIFNSTSRTVFPLTDDYDLITSQLDYASTLLTNVQSESSIEQLSDADYQEIANWLDGTQQRNTMTSLIGDGLVSCAALLPNFTYESQERSTMPREHSIVLATDNVVTGSSIYTLEQALDLASSASIRVDGLYAGSEQTLGSDTALEMEELLTSHGGQFLSTLDNASIESLVKMLNESGASRNQASDSEQQAGERTMRANSVDAPGIVVVALALCMVAWIALAARLRR